MKFDGQATTRRITGWRSGHYDVVFDSKPTSDPTKATVGLSVALRHVTFTCGWCGQSEEVPPARFVAVSDPRMGISVCQGWEIADGLIICPECVQRDEWDRMMREYVQAQGKVFHYTIPNQSTMDARTREERDARRRNVTRRACWALNYRDACRRAQWDLDHLYSPGEYIVIYGIGEPETDDQPIAVAFTEELG